MNSPRRLSNRTGLSAVARIAGLFLLLGLFAAGCAVFSEVSFYANLARASAAGRRFYRTYDHLEKDVAYTSRSDMRLDVYSPESGDRHPVLLFIHGGGWDSYDKELFAPVAMQFVPRDIVVVLVDYTLYPDAGYELMAAEIADSVAWTLENISRYGGDPERVILSGHSAGGHLSGLVAFDSRWLSATGNSPSNLAAWIGLSGVYDIDSQMAYERSRGGTAPIMTAVMGGENNFPDASPSTYVPGATELPPLAVVIHGALDTTVPVSMSESMARTLSAAPLTSRLIVYPEAGHSDFLFDALSDDDAQVIEDIVGIAQRVSASR